MKKRKKGKLIDRLKKRYSVLVCEHFKWYSGEWSQKAFHKMRWIGIELSCVGKKIDLLMDRV